MVTYGNDTQTTEEYFKWCSKVWKKIDRGFQGL